MEWKKSCVLHRNLLHLVNDPLAVEKGTKSTPKRKKRSKPAKRETEWQQKNETNSDDGSSTYFELPYPLKGGNGTDKTLAHETTCAPFP